MPHVLELGTTLSDILYNYSVPAIRPKVIMTAQAKVSLSVNVDGSHNWTSFYRKVSIDLTDRLNESSPIRLVTKIPGVPSGKGNAAQGSNVSISLLNPDTYIATTQDGSIIDPDSIRAARIKVYATFGNQEFQVYEGKVIGEPEEKQGETIFTIRDAVSDIIDRPVKWENLSPDQSLSASGGVYNVSYYAENNARFHSAATYFDYRGLPVPSFQNSGNAIGLLNIDFTGTDIVLRSLDIAPYTITFTTSTNFILQGPNIPDYAGSIDQEFLTPFCKILPEYWNVIGDPAGTKITFTVFYTVSGNPVSIMKRIIEHAFLGTWGNTPTEPSIIPVDWNRFNELEALYSGHNVFVSETNKDVSVFSYTSDEKPLSAKRICEYLSEHIGCYLITDNQGRISLTNHYLSPGNIVGTINSDMILSHRFPGGQKRYDVLSVSYGLDGLNGSFTSEFLYTRDTITEYSPSESYEAGDIVKLNGVFYQANEDNPAGIFVLESWDVFNAETYRFSFRYYKTGVSDVLVRNMTCTFLDKIFTQHQQVNCEIIPQIGLPLIAGDRVQLVLSEQPRRTIYAEAIRVSKVIGGNAVVTFQRIAEPKRPDTWCIGSYCSGTYFE